MKRDLNLVREILRFMEAQNHGLAPDDGWNIQIAEYSDDQIRYHIYLMGQAGLLETVTNTAIGDTVPSALPLNMTWAGHEFLSAAADDTVWAAVLKKVGGGLSTIAFALLQELLLAQARPHLGLS